MAYARHCTEEATKWRQGSRSRKERTIGLVTKARAVDTKQDATTMALSAMIPLETEKVWRFICRKARKKLRDDLVSVRPGLHGGRSLPRNKVLTQVSGRN